MKMLNVNVNGNKKLKNGNGIRFMIWNLPAQITCPYATEHCKKFCYAKKAERVYPQVLPCRENNLNESRSADFVENMIYTIENRLNSKAFAGKKVYFRIHESGDFYNQQYTDAWLNIARHFENNHNIVFLAYTKSVKFFVSRSIPANMIIRYSIWDDSNKRDIEIARDLHLPIYTADTAENVSTMVEKKRYSFCECKDCSACGMCYKKEYNKIVCEIH